MQIEGDKVSENTLSSEVLNMASHYLVYNRQVGPARDKTITPTFFQLWLEGGHSPVGYIK